MKKYVSLFLIILCLFTQNVSATTSKNNDTFTIDQNTLGTPASETGGRQADV